ncbi:alpha-ketoglutarate-dependent dioxygenase alkB homolog 7, mitochondrial-like [Ruditapes philippinarum]|uniref:alpha-ketoglutarate-dependent dioxygenase alkB homolog 7, mitochondrial-like n=1 Tax=Ruditapes philippinarum TaxID=129788 RepID=UPI00295B0FEB|nr:alpha-ketoglutarate-dependent dioxygenase alkB homolog 7, mitochondrial-like [Ruditapes philippinarum]
MIGMTMKEFMKFCSNMIVSSKITPVSRTPIHCCRCLYKRNFSRTKASCTRLNFHQNLDIKGFLKHLKSCGSFSVDSYLLGRYNTNNFICNKHYTVSTNAVDNSKHKKMEFSDEDTKTVLSEDMQVINDFISEEEEEVLFQEVEPHLKRLRYESSHWDDAIHGYRETERKTWTEKNKAIIQRVRDAAFPAGVPQLAHVHVLDLQKEGYIKAHVDAVKFCGSTIAGISLLSPCIMRLVHTDDKTKFADILLERRSLYIMKDAARYNYTHEVLPDNSVFGGQTITKDRRISVICRNEP